MNRKLKNGVLAVLMGALLTSPVLAAEAKKAPGDALKKEISMHRAMAEAHSNAAACLESGKPLKQCEDQLQKDCKGLAIGKHCGMKHAH